MAGAGGGEERVQWRGQAAQQEAHQLLDQLHQTRVHSLSLTFYSTYTLPLNALTTHTQPNPCTGAAIFKSWWYLPIPRDMLASTHSKFCFRIFFMMYLLPNCQNNWLKSKGPGLNCPALLSRGWRFSGYSFTTVCIEPTYHSARSGPALDDSWDEYFTIKYV